MKWITEHEKEILIWWLDQTPCCYFAAGADGEIFWANEAFCEWTGYTLNELSRIGWLKLSMDDANLTADVESAEQLKAGLRLSYEVQKKLIPKQGVPKWGTLHARRYPILGDFKFSVCHWQPFHNSSDAALALAMDRCNIITGLLKDMTKEITTLTVRTEESKWIDSTINMAKNHPKIALFIVSIALAVFGVNNMLELLQRSGMVPEPAPEQTASASPQ